ncbi:paternally-expressed gene 3 protein [Dipodomys merriami]|uniref:paternally-expressed gene 3 protein n=1 Tax=Dipodomys merriami TaxID=94247 RepID=UPI003855F20A
MYQREDDANSNGDMRWNRGGTPPARPAPSFSSDRDRDRDRDGDWDRRGRSRDVEPRDRWAHSRSPRGRLPHRDLSLPVMARASFQMEREEDGVSMDYESRSQDAESYRSVMEASEDRKSQNPIQDNMENYRKLLSLGVQLAEDDRHSHMTQGHSSRAKRSAYPSTSRGLKTMPEAKKPSHRRGICEDESSHGVIMEKFIKDAAHGSRSGRAREPNDRLQRFPRVPDDHWRDSSLNRREPLAPQRGYEGSAFRGGFRFNPNLIARRRALERKRRYHFDTEGKSGAHEHKGSARKKPFECGSEMRRATSTSSLASASSSESQPSDLGATAYVCDECGRSFTVISEFVEHQIMHTRENLYEYGESFVQSSTPSEGPSQSHQSGGKRFECRECGEAFTKSAALAEHRRIHAREYLAECKDQESEEQALPSPTFSELQKMYGKDKFYECRVCKETFLHSSALIEHQKVHEVGSCGGDEASERDYEPGRGAAFMPGAALREFQKMYGKNKIYECKVCGDSFLHSSSLKEHLKIHARGNPFESKSPACEGAFTPSPSLKRRQKTYTKEKFFDVKDGRDPFMQNADLSEQQKIHSRKNFFNGRGYEKSAVHSMPFTESQKSHTITRPPEDEEEEKAFTISSNPDEAQTPPTKENAYEGKFYEKSNTHCLGSAEAQKSVAGFTKPTVPAMPATHSSEVPNYMKARFGENSSAGKEYLASITRSLAIPRSLKRYYVNKEAGCDEKGESSTYLSDLHNKRRKIPARESPYDGDSNDYRDATMPSTSYAEPQRSLAGDRACEFKQDGVFSVPTTSVRSHQKARAKKKYIEPTVYHSLPFGELPIVRPREKLYECQECGESFYRSSDLIEHQKIHDREKPSGSGLSINHSMTITSPQTSYTQEQYAEEQAHDKSNKSATNTSLPVQWDICTQEKTPGKGTYAEKTQRQTQEQKMDGQEAQEQKMDDQETQEQKMDSHEIQDQKMDSQEIQDQEIDGQEIQDQKMDDQEIQDQEIDVQEIYVQESQDQEIDVQEIQDQEIDIQVIQDQEIVVQEIQDQEMDAQETQSQEIDAQETHGEDTCDQGINSEESQGQEMDDQESQDQETGEDTISQVSSSDEQKDEPEDTIYECQECGLGFVYLTDLTSHQDVHSRKCLVDSREYALSDVHMHSLSEYQKECAGEQLFECPKCGESFIHSSFLFEHQRVHEQDQLYSVKGCDDGFICLLPVKSRRSRAAERNPAVAGAAIRCLQCGQGFIHSSALNEHLRHHRDEEFLEQTEAGEEIFIQTLALTEFQGSETEEKLFECTVCGECFFTAKQLGDHHTKVHKDEPYEYGASFTHASFLTEPLRRPGPFYECRDCGQAFMHDTILTKHTVFDPEDEEDDDEEEEEEEAATAQEVEVNVLIPQEVLRIQGSNVEAAEPEVEAAEPEVEAAEPDVEAAEPDGEAEGPDGEAAEADGEAEQPNGGAEHPNGDADEPDGVDIEDPEERVEEPEGDADEPDGAGIQDPEEEGEEQERLYYNCQECTETFASSAAFGEHLRAHASLVLPSNAPGEGAGPSAAQWVDHQYFRCDVCGQLFNDRLSLARHQNTHTG